MNRPARSIWHDALIATPLAAVMSAGWAWARWAELRAGVLPDTDDLMRLQQVRDWLGGQGFADLTQHRLGIDGVAMHWSRLPDLVPAGIVALLRGVTGEPFAEMAMLLLWPALLFATFLTLGAGIARSLGARPVDAMIVALLAYPATTVFAPGRIDHHGLQLALLLTTLFGLIARPTRASGAMAGIAAVASLTIGMETVPLLAAAIGAALIRWAVDPREDARLTGLAVALGLGGIAALAFATDSWRFAGCDGFNRLSWSAAMIGAGAVIVLAMVQSRLRVRGRVVALVGTGFGVIAAVAVVAPACLSPYGAVDPTLARAWLSQVAEAQGSLQADPRWAIAYAGLLVAAIVGGLWSDRIDPRADRRILLAVAITSLGLSFIQIRGAYGGAAVAVPLLAEVIARARRHGTGAVLVARIAATGIVYPLAASAMPVRVAASPVCDMAAAQAALLRLPTARVLAPIDMGPWLITATPHRAIAGPYHRNTAGNLAVVRFETAVGVERQRIARALRIDYWVGCSGSGTVPTGVPALWRLR